MDPHLAIVGFGVVVRQLAKVVHSGAGAGGEGQQIPAGVLGASFQSDGLHTLVHGDSSGSRAVTVPIVHLHIHPVKASLGLFPGHDQLAVLAHSPDVEDVTGGIKVHIGSFALGAVSANSVLGAKDAPLVVIGDDVVIAKEA